MGSGWGYIVIYIYGMGIERGYLAMERGRCQTWLGHLSDWENHRTFEFVDSPASHDDTKWSPNLPSGKHTKKTMERSTIFNGQINYFDWAMFNSKLLVYQRLIPIISPINPTNPHGLPEDIGIFNEEIGMLHGEPNFFGPSPWSTMRWFFTADYLGSRLWSVMGGRNFWAP